MSGAGLRATALAAVLLLPATLPGCKDDAIRPPISVTAADSADQILEGMEHIITADGVRRTRVIADTAYIYENTQLARLKLVTVTFYNANGYESSTVKGDSGIYHMRDGSMEAWGHVVGTTPDGKTLKSQELKYDSRTEEISSTTSFVFDKPGQHLEGNGFVSDPDFANVKAGQPRARQLPGQAGGGILLPGQQP